MYGGLQQECLVLIWPRQPQQVLIYILCFPVYFASVLYNRVLRPSAVLIAEAQEEEKKITALGSLGPII